MTTYSTTITDGDSIEGAHFKVRRAVYALCFDGAAVTIEALRERLGWWVSETTIRAACELMGQKIA